MLINFFIKRKPGFSSHKEQVRSKVIDSKPRQYSYLLHCLEIRSQGNLIKIQSVTEFNYLGVLHGCVVFQGQGGASALH